MKKVFLIVLLILFAQLSFGQQFTDLYGNYLRKTSPGNAPVVFVRGIVSTEYQSYKASAFYHDGNEVFWTL